jgi:hypothetical protein
VSVINTSPRAPVGTCTYRITLARDRDIESHDAEKYFPEAALDSLVNASVAEMISRHKLDVDVSRRYYEIWHEERFGVSANRREPQARMGVRSWNSPTRGTTMLAFDLRELRNADVHIAPLPDEQGLVIDARALPCAFARHLERHGLDTSKPIRVVGIIGRRPDGGPGLYAIHFKQD